MTATKTFIKDAIEGGWNEILPSQIDYCHDGIVFRVGMESDWKSMKHEQVLLDPLAWRAVSKVRGWDEHDAINQRAYNKSVAAGLMLAGMYGHMRKMHRFIDLLDDGRTIEEALKSLETN